MKTVHSIFFSCNIILFSLHGFAAPQQDSAQYPYREMPAVYPGTQRLNLQGDLSSLMLDGAHRFIEEKISQSVTKRHSQWKAAGETGEEREQLMLNKRQQLARYIGLEDRAMPMTSFNVGLKETYPAPGMQKVAELGDPELVAETGRYRVYQVKWPVLNRVYGEGLLLKPKSNSRGTVVAIPDADITPEQLIGLKEGVPAESQFARHLAESGYQVIVPVIISRTRLFGIDEKQQSYREWLYRQAYHMGKHIIGYEVQKVLAAVDWIKKNNPDHHVGVAGYGEGGLLAFYSAAIDTRIGAALVSGYFTNRQRVWDEPIYRNVWRLLRDFGDAEIASMIAPRGLVVEYSRAPVLTDEIKDHAARKLQMEGLPYTGYKGKLEQPAFKTVKDEFERIDKIDQGGKQNRQLVSASNGGALAFGSKPALQSFTRLLNSNNDDVLITKELPQDQRKNFSDSLRQVRQFREIEDHVQELVRDGDKRRNQFFLHKVMPEFARRVWSTRPYHQYHDPSRFVEAAGAYRKYFGEEVIGLFDDSLVSANPRTRKVFDKPRFHGYEVVLDVYKDLFATGILLIPKDLKKGERRPVVVCQHGRNDVPSKIVEGNFTIYNDAAAKLADQGFVVYVPQNPYRGEDRYRWLSRKGNTIGKTLFSFIVAQHDQTTRWLSALPFVDKKRIAFYGLSYGGQTAMRVPALLDAYCLSICSGDFGDGARKVTDAHYEGSFVNTIEWEMPYFNMGNTFSYAEMSYLIFPRPFMVERGHHDLVQPPEWVNYEYGKVRYFYDQFGMGNRTEMEQFNGGHTMRGVGTFAFLHEHLQWP